MDENVIGNLGLGVYHGIASRELYLHVVKLIFLILIIFGILIILTNREANHYNHVTWD